MERALKGKVAVVTGASSGIGEATARELASRGASVVLASRALDRLEALQRKISASGGVALAVETDVSDRGSVEAMVGRAVGELGSLDVLVNNAGLGLSGRITEVRTEDVLHVFEVNAIGPLNCIQSALPYMGKGGRIINVSSVVGRRAIPKVGAYCASKFALNALSDALRVEVADRVSQYQCLSRDDPYVLQGELQTHEGREARLAPEGRYARESRREDSGRGRKVPATST